MKVKVKVKEKEEEKHPSVENDHAIRALARKAGKLANQNRKKGYH